MRDAVEAKPLAAGEACRLKDRDGSSIPAAILAVSEPPGD